MEVVYKKPIIEKLESAILDSKYKNLPIEYIVLTKEEYGELSISFTEWACPLFIYKAETKEAYAEFMGVRIYEEGNEPC